MAKELPHAIPALKDPAALQEWLDKKRKALEMKKRDADHPERLSDRIAVSPDQFWYKKGENTYEVEFAPFIEQLMTACEHALEKEKGAIKIVSFGGGKMDGMLTLRAALEEGWRQKTGQRASIQIIDFSLSKGLSVAHGMKEGERDMSAWRDVTLHIGPIELRDLLDAQDASIMVSMFGPFYHADRGHIYQLVRKAVMYLKVNGEAFLHLPPADGGTEVELQNDLLKILGSRFEVIVSRPPIEGRYVKNIELLKVKRLC